MINSALKRFVMMTLCEHGHWLLPNSFVYHILPTMLGTNHGMVFRHFSHGAASWDCLLRLITLSTMVKFEPRFHGQNVLTTSLCPPPTHTLTVILYVEIVREYKTQLKKKRNSRGKSLFSCASDFRAKKMTKMLYMILKISPWLYLDNY